MEPTRRWIAPARGSSAALAGLNDAQDRLSGACRVWLGSRATDSRFAQYSPEDLVYLVSCAVK
jgi:hypothetical protein